MIYVVLVGGIQPEVSGTLPADVEVFETLVDAIDHAKDLSLSLGATCCIYTMTLYGTVEPVLSAVFIEK